MMIITNPLPVGNARHHSLSTGQRPGKQVHFSWNYIRKKKVLYRLTGFPDLLQLLGFEDMNGITIHGNNAFILKFFKDADGTFF